MVRPGVVALLVALPSVVLPGRAEPLQVLPGHASAPGAAVDEYRLKAAILYNLTKFVEWPPTAFGDSSAPLVLCIIDIDPFGPRLDDALRGHTVGGRPLVVRRTAEAARGCHLLFIANSERRRLATIIDQLRKTAALTVGDIEDFIDQGGMIGLSTEGDRVRFDINIEAAGQARLKVNSRLMALAATIKRAGATR